MKSVSDSTPLIRLAKIGCINLLKKVFAEIIIENEIYREIIEKGTEHSEIPIIRKLIEERFIIARETIKKIEIPNLHEGEKRSISLCKQLNIENILIDEEEGFNITTMFNLIPIRTTSLLIIFLDKNLISLREYRESLKRLSESGYFLDALTYERLLNIGKNLRK